MAAHMVARKILFLTMGIVIIASISMIIALGLHAYLVSISRIHKIKIGDEIMHGLTFDGVINDTLAIGFGKGIGIVYVEIDKLPFSLGERVTIYGYGSDWLELRIKVED